MARDLVAAKVHLEKAAAMIRRHPDEQLEQTGETLHGVAEKIDDLAVSLQNFIV